MDNFTEQQIQKIPWMQKFSENPVIKEPKENEIINYIKIPFIKRSNEYPLFYSWYESTKLPLDIKAKVLDAGCGTGITSEILNQYGFKVWACDIEESFFRANKAEINYFTQDLNKPLPFEDSFFDGVVACEVITVLNYSEFFIREVKRVLKNGGFFNLAFPNISSIKARYSFFINGYPFGADNPKSVLERKNIVTLLYISKLCESLGFKLIDVRGNVPQKSYKTKIFEILFGKKLKNLNNDIIKYSHGYILKFQLEK